MYNKPTPAEELKALRTLLWDLHLHRTLTQNVNQAKTLMKRLDTYIEAHSKRPTEDDEAYEQRVYSAFWNFIAQDPAKGQRVKVKKGSQ